MSDLVLRKFFMVRKPKSETVSLPEGANAPRESRCDCERPCGSWLPFPKSSSVDRLEPTIFLTSNLHSSLRRIQSGRARKQPDQVLLPIIVLLGSKGLTSRLASLGLEYFSPNPGLGD
jgi:hypothetical protein